MLKLGRNLAQWGALNTSTALHFPSEAPSPLLAFFPNLLLLTQSLKGYSGEEQTRQERECHRQLDPKRVHLSP